MPNKYSLSTRKIFSGAVLLTLGISSLAGCGTTNSNEQGSHGWSNGENTASASPVASSTKGGFSRPESASSSSSAKNMSDSTELPAGYTMFDSPIQGIQIPIPENWVMVNSETSFNGTEGQKLLTDISKAMGQTDEEKVEASLAGSDLTAVAPTPEKNFPSEYIGSPGKSIKGEAELPTEETMKKRLAMDDFPLDKYEKVDTPRGEAVVAYSAVTYERSKLDTAEIIMPSGHTGEFASLVITAGSADRTKELVKVILENWKQLGEHTA